MSLIVSLVQTPYDINTMLLTRMVAADNVSAVRDRVTPRIDSYGFSRKVPVSMSNYFSLPLLQIHPLKDTKEIEAKAKLDDPTDIWSNKASGVYGMKSEYLEVNNIYNAR